MPEDIKADEIVMDTAKTYVKHEKKVSRIAYCFLLLIIVLLLVFMPKGDEESSEYLAYELPEGLRYVSIPVEMQSETDNSVYRISINALVSDLPSGSEKILFTEIYNLDSGLPLVGNCDIKLFRHDEAEKIEVFVNGIVSSIDYEPGLVNYSETYNTADGHITQIQFNGSEGSDGLLYNGKQQGGYVYYHGWHEFK